MSVSERDSQRSLGAVTGSKWASGRCLTDVQRARKRAVDRARSRQHRLSTLNRIAELEDKLERVLPEICVRRSEESTAAENVNALLRTRHHANSDIQQSETQLTPVDETKITDWALTAPSGDTIETSSLPGLWQGEFECSSNRHRNGSPENLSYFNVSNLRETVGAAPPDRGLQLPKSIPLRRGDVPALWISEAIRTNNTNLLMEAQDARKVDVCLDDQINQDVLIRGVIEGWDVVKSRGKTCPLWEILRSVDYLLFWMASPITRLVMLRMIHHMLLFKAYGKRLDELPPWFRPRPTQTVFTHDELIDFFAWPGFRERLVVSQQDILTNDFWDCFRRDFRFQWPLEFREIYRLSPSTSRYHFSALFESQHRQISMWRMEPRFFASFPQLLDDISVTEAIPWSLERSPDDCNSGVLSNTGFDGVNALEMNNYFNA